MGNVPVSILGLESLGFMFNKQPEMPRQGVQMSGFLAFCLYSMESTESMLETQGIGRTESFILRL